MTLRITVIGTGYLGAVTAACLADLGHKVVGIDVDPDKIALLTSGQAPFFEPGLPEILQRALASGRLSFSTDFAAARAAQVHFICVGTPQRLGENAADLTYVEAAVTQLAEVLRESPGGPHLVVGKSTVPVGTAARLAELLRQKSGPQVRLAWNPEFLREGFAVIDTMRPDRLVFGTSGDAESQQDLALLRSVFADALASNTPVVECDYATAELVKSSANAFLATKISFINAMSEVCEAAGADVSLLAEAIGHDDRIGSKFLRAGIGFGGGCLPKDIRAFMARAGELGADQALTFLREVDAINLRRRSRMVDLARAECGDTFVGQRVAVLGAAFKPNSDDIRDSPALSIAEYIRQLGARVTVHDPQALKNAREVWPDLRYATSVPEAIAGSHVVLHLTEWSEYRQLDPAALATLVASPRIIDGRNALDPKVWQDAGWVYRALGRPNI